jgi:hypothetical protein
MIFFTVMIPAPLTRRHSGESRKSMNTDRRDISTGGVQGSRIKPGMTHGEPYRLRKVRREEPSGARNGTTATIFSLKAA